MYTTSMIRLVVLLLVPGCGWIGDDSWSRRLDLDADGVLIPDDCDPDDPQVGAATTWYADVDGDGHGTEVQVEAACAPPVGFVSTAGDCDDSDAETYPGAFEGCDGQDRDCDGEVASSLLVDPGSQQGYENISDAVANATDGDTICVAAGIYQENLDLGDLSVALVSIGGAAQTSIVATVSDPVVRIAGGDPVRLQGFTVRGGSADVGGGISVSGGAVALVSVAVIGNEATERGGGLYTRDAEVVIEDSSFQDNVVEHNQGPGGGVYVDGGQVLIVNTRFEGNLGTDGGLTLDGGGELSLDGVTFFANIGLDCGGVCVASGSLDARHLDARENEGSFGAALAAATGTEVSISNAIFAANQADNEQDVAAGGGIWSAAARLALTNVVFYGNYASTMGAGLYVASGADEVEIVNTSFAENVAAGGEGGAISVAGSPSVRVRYSHFNDGAAPVVGTEDPFARDEDGNITGDPVFVDVSGDAADAWDLTLGAGSPLVDAGDPAILDEDGSRSDMGAYGGPSSSW